MTVAKAREAARKFLANPDEARAQAEVGKFPEIARNFIRRHVVEKEGLRSKPEFERILRVYVSLMDDDGKVHGPRWRDRPFLTIRRRDINGLLDDIVDGKAGKDGDLGGPVMADRVLAVLSKLTRWYQAQDENYVAPVVPGMRRTNPKQRARKRILNDDEIRALWKACDDAGTFGALIKTLLLTAQRREKVATMRWADVANGVWNIPAEAREKSNAGTLQLPQMALDVIDKQPKIEGNPYVFAGRGRAAFNSFSQRKEELDAKLKSMAPWTLHDLRRTSKTLMSRAGVSSDHSERVLGHVIGGVKGIYDRFAYLEEKATALRALAALVERIVNPPSGDNVVEFPSASQA